MHLTTAEQLQVGVALTNIGNGNEAFRLTPESTQQALVELDRFLDEFS